MRFTELTKEQKQPFYWGGASLLLGVVLCTLGEIGWIFGMVPLALGLGSVAAGFTDCEPPRRRIKSNEQIAKEGAAERSAISAAVCAGMKDGSFYRDPKGTISGARSTFKEEVR